MARQIKAIKMESLRHALNIISHELDGVNIYTLAGDRYEDRKNGKPLQWGINWSACGTQDTATTKKFMQDMTTAVEICETLNKLEILDITIVDEQEYTLEQFNKQAETAKKLIELGDIEFINLWLDKEVQ